MENNTTVVPPTDTDSTLLVKSNFSFHIEDEDVKVLAKSYMMYKIGKFSCILSMVLLS